MEQIVEAERLYEWNEIKIVGKIQSSLLLQTSVGRIFPYMWSFEPDSKEWGKQRKEARLKKQVLKKS